MASKVESAVSNVSKVEKPVSKARLTVQKYAGAWLNAPINLPKSEVGYMVVPARCQRKNHGDKTKKDPEVTPPDKNSKEAVKIDLRTLIGTYTVDETTWRVLGMIPGTYKPRKAVENIPKPTDASPLICDFSVLQLPQVFKLAGKPVKETIPRNKNEHILRICFSENEEQLGQFRQERELLKIMRKKYGNNKRFYDHFPRVLAEGEFAKLKGIEESDNIKERCWVYEPTIHKPFFIMEKIGPSLEEFRMCQPVGDKVTSYGSIFIILGCLRVLRLVHDAGIAVCDVRPSHFALRLGPSGMLHRRESDVIGLIVLTNFNSARAYRSQPYKKQKTWIGTKKYASPEVMTRLPPGPVDDAISCMYMFYEFLTGQLPWVAKTENKIGKALPNKEIIKEKKKVESADEVMDHTGGKDALKAKPLFLRFNQIFREIRKANGYDVPIDHDEVTRLMLTGVTHRDDYDRGRTTFSFQHPMMYSYRHGLEDKDAAKKGVVQLFPEDAKTGESDEIRIKANWLFSYATNKTKDDAAKKSQKSTKD